MFRVPESEYGSKCKIIVDAHPIRRKGDGTVLCIFIVHFMKKNCHSVVKIKI